MMSNGDYKIFGDITGIEKSYSFNETSILLGYSGVTEIGNNTYNHICSLSLITFNTDRSTCFPEAPQL